MKFSDALLKRLGVNALTMIEENIAAGVDIDGKAYQYSTKPFFMPWSQSLQRKLGGKKGEGTYYEYAVSKKTGAFGMLILGGYKAFKEKTKPDVANDFLTYTGKMLRGMKVLRRENDSVTIGWSDPRLAQIAFYLNVSGAGKSRKLWKFLGLRLQQQDALAKMMAPQIMDEVTKQFINNLKSHTTK